MPCYSPQRMLAVVLLSATLLFHVSPVQAAGPHWIRIDSGHFSVLTDADEKQGREVAVRFEQMRLIFGQLLMRSRVNMPEPLEIIAFKSAEGYAKVAPMRDSKPIAESGFCLHGDDRNYFVLNLSAEEPWRAVAYEFARVFLDYNYPPTQSWFDQGFAEYFSSLRLSDKQTVIGGTTESFIELLKGPGWISLPELFATRHATWDPPAGRRRMFHAESWIVLHYLLNKSRLPDTGTYFGSVENDKLPIEDAIQKAYGMRSAQLEQAVQAYFVALASSAHTQGSGKQPASPPGETLLAATVTADEIGSSRNDIPDAIARALVGEMSLRLPEHREQARKDLDFISADPKTDNLIVHRALGWDLMDRKDFDAAIDELAKAVSLDPKDPWTHYYLALWKYREAQASGGETKSLANMIQDLHIVLDWDHEFAEAYYMLGLAQLEGGSLHAATDSMRAAVQLNPRSESYLLGMARVYLTGKNWEAATAMLGRLSNSSDAKIAEAARQELSDLPYWEKYGVPPVRSTTAKPAEKAAPVPPAPASKAPAAPPTRAKTAAAPLPAQSSDDNAEQTPVEPQIDKRPIVYAKGKLISVDCSQPPSAVLTVSAGARTLKLKTPDYKSLTLIGADQFSCAWANQAVSVNYKAGGKADGDLVSLEMR